MAGRLDLGSCQGVISNCSSEPTVGPAGSDACGEDVRPIRETGEAALCETGILAGDRRNPRPSGRGAVKKHLTDPSPLAANTRTAEQLFADSIRSFLRGAVPEVPEDAPAPRELIARYRETREAAGA